MWAKTSKGAQVFFVRTNRALPVDEQREYLASHWTEGTSERHRTRPEVP